VGYDVAVSPDGEYFALIEGYEPQYFYIYSKDGVQKFRYKKISDIKNVFVFSPVKNYFLFKNGDKIEVINRDKKGNFFIEKAIPLKGDLVVYSGNKENIIISTIYNKYYVLTVYNTDSKKYYQFNFAYPVFGINKLDDEGTFVLYNLEKFWVIKIR